MKIENLMQKIIDSGTKEDMNKLSDIVIDMFYDLRDYDEELFDKYKMCMYKIAYGEVLSEEMAEEIIESMKPYGMHWTLEETKMLQQQNGLMTLRDIDFWVVMNSAYNDFNEIFNDDLDMYVKYTKKFILDEDAKDGKVFKYFTKIVK